MIWIVFRLPGLPGTSLKLQQNLFHPDRLTVFSARLLRPFFFLGLISFVLSHVCCLLQKIRFFFCFPSANRDFDVFPVSGFYFPEPAEWIKSGIHILSSVCASRVGVPILCSLWISFRIIHSGKPSLCRDYLKTQESGPHYNHLKQFVLKHFVCRCFYLVLFFVLSLFLAPAASQHCPPGSRLTELVVSSCRSPHEISLDDIVFLNPICLLTLSSYCQLSDAESDQRICSFLLIWITSLRSIRLYFLFRISLPELLASLSLQEVL